jgi:hypothetical protein
LFLPPKVRSQLPTGKKAEKTGNVENEKQTKTDLCPKHDVKLATLACVEKRAPL